MIKTLIKRRFLIPLTIWIVLYMSVFLWLEIFPPQEVHMIHCGLDDRIPYIQMFVYPYLSWFPYILICMYCSMKYLSDQDYKKAVFVLTFGMNVFLAACFLYPSGLSIRDGIVYNTALPSGVLLKFVQGVDVPKNVFPSMHVFVTLGFQYAMELLHSRLPVWGLYLTRATAFLIIVSTVLIKQHSVLDVSASFLMFLVLRWAAQRIWRRES